MKLTGRKRPKERRPWEKYYDTQCEGLWCCVECPLETRRGSKRGEPQQQRMGQRSKEGKRTLMVETNEPNSGQERTQQQGA